MTATEPKIVFGSPPWGVLEQPYDKKLSGTKLADTLNRAYEWAAEQAVCILHVPLTQFHEYINVMAGTQWKPSQYPIIFGSRQAGQITVGMHTGPLRNHQCFVTGHKGAYYNNATLLRSFDHYNSSWFTYNSTIVQWPNFSIPKKEQRSQ